MEYVIGIIAIAVISLMIMGGRYIIAGFMVVVFGIFLCCKIHDHHQMKVKHSGFNSDTGRPNYKVSQNLVDEKRYANDDKNNFSDVDGTILDPLAEETSHARMPKMSGEIIAEFVGNTGVKLKKTFTSDPKKGKWYLSTPDNIHRSKPEVIQDSVETEEEFIKFTTVDGKEHYATYQGDVECPGRSTLEEAYFGTWTADEHVGQLALYYGNEEGTVIRGYWWWEDSTIETDRKASPLLLEFK